MATKVAINGFGRIGRAVARILLQKKGETIEGSQIICKRHDLGIGFNHRPFICQIQKSFFITGELLPAFNAGSTIQPYLLI